MSEFIPKDPQTLVGFDNVLAEFNKLEGANTVFTNDYMLRWDIYVGTETTADGYEVHTIQHESEGPILSENVYMYKPDAYAVFNAISERWCGDEECIVYIEELEDYISDLEYYMLEELNANFINYIDSHKIPE